MNSVGGWLRLEMKEESLQARWHAPVMEGKWLASHAAGKGEEGGWLVSHAVILEGW